MGDESKIVPYPHGNSKNAQPFVPTKPSSMNKFRQSVFSQTPNQAYKLAVNSNDNPRNAKLFSNLKQKLNKERRLEWDEITNLHVLHYEIETIHKITTIPDLRVSVYDLKLVNEINNMLKFTNKVKINFFIFYLKKN